MTPDQYRKLRESIGTQPEVARLQGVSTRTIAGREAGTTRITPEAARALKWLAQEFPSGKAGG